MSKFEWNTNKNNLQRPFLANKSKNRFGCVAPGGYWQLQSRFNQLNRLKWPKRRAIWHDGIFSIKYARSHILNHSKVDFSMIFAPACLQRLAATIAGALWGLVPFRPSGKGKRHMKWSDVSQLRPTGLMWCRIGGRCPLHNPPFWRNPIAQGPTGQLATSLFDSAFSVRGTKFGI